MNEVKHFLCMCLITCAEGTVNLVQGYKNPIFVNQVELLQEVMKNFKNQKMTNVGLTVLNIIEVSSDQYKEFFRIPKIIQLPKFES